VTRYVNDERVKFRTVARCSLSDARNAGCFLAQGRYLAITDADDISTPDRLKVEVDFMDRNPGVGLVGGAIEVINATGKVLCEHHFPTETRELKANLLTRCLFCQPTVLIRREAFMRVGAYRPVFASAEDYDLWLRIAEHYEIANLAKVVLKYRIHPGQLSALRWRRQALCAVGARVSALARRKGRADPLDGVEEITPGFLRSVGVTEQCEQTALAREYLAYFRYLWGAGYALGDSELGECPFDEFSRADRWVIADLRLSAARARWRQGRYFQSVFSMGQAVSKRPIILGRPFKSLLRFGISR
jgi:hypothetical protein